MVKKTRVYHTAICIVTALVSVAAFASAWDAWWRVSIGTNEFWTAPHMLMVLCVVLALGISLYHYFRTYDTVWHKLSLFLFLVPIGGLLDYFWHATYGTESLRSSLLLWSPAHLLMVYGGVFSLIVCLNYLRSFTSDVPDRTFSIIGYSALAWLALLIVTPLSPLSPYRLLGTWGFGYVAFLLILILLSAQEQIKERGAVFHIVALFLLFTIASFPETVGIHVDINPYIHVPHWLTIFAFLSAALLIELLIHHSKWSVGALSGLVLGAILFGGISNSVLVPALGIFDVCVAALMGALGGLLAGLVLGVHKHIKSF